MSDITLSDAKAIDAVIRSYPWLDCDVAQCSRWEMIVHGAIDPGYPDLILHFRDIAFVSSAFEWRTDTSAPVFSVLDGPEARELNLAFRVQQGYSIFEFRADDLAQPCRIAARSVELIQLREPPK